MLNPLKKLAFAASLGASIASLATVASAMPVFDAVTIRNAAPPTVEKTQWRGGGWGWGWGFNWFGGGIILNPNFFHRYGFNDFHRGFGNTWAHNPDHRLGVPYANRAVANRYGGSAGFRGAAAFRGAPAVRGGNAFAGRTEGHFAAPERGSSESHSAFGGIRSGGETRMQSDHGYSSIGHSSYGGGGGGGFRGGGGGGGFGGGGGGGFHGGGGGRR